MLGGGADLLAGDTLAEVTLGGVKVDHKSVLTGRAAVSAAQPVETGTGMWSVRYDSTAIKPEMGEITFTGPSTSPASPGAGTSISPERSEPRQRSLEGCSAAQAPGTSPASPGAGTSAEGAQAPNTFSPLWVKSISTTEGGAKPVLDALFCFAEEGELLFDEDIVTDYPRKLAIADVIREKYLAHLHQELPHELGIIVKRVVDEGSRWKSEAEVLVNRPSQKPIVIGRAASTIKAVRKAAERELKEVFGVPVSLELWVNVEPNWMKNQKLLAEMGYLGGLV
jgi:hypothetical protein